MALKLRNEAEAREAWIGFGTEDAPDSGMCWENFLSQHAPHIAEAVATERVTAAFGTVVEVQGENLVVANGFGGTTTVAARGTRRTDARGEQKARQTAAAAAPPVPSGDVLDGVSWQEALAKATPWIAHVFADRKFDEADVTPKLHWLAQGYAKRYEGKFDYMLDMRHAMMQSGKLSLAQAKGTLNCLRAAIVRGDAIIDAVLDTAPAEAPEQPRKGNTRGVNKFAGSCDLCGQQVGVAEGERDLGDDGKWHVFHVDGCPTTFPFPEGRYAVENGDGELRFYHLTRGLVFVQASDNEHRVESKAACDVIIAKIAADVAGASRAYGREIGSCGVCNRTLTNTESRAAGIGPICQAKMGW